MRELPRHPDSPQTVTTSNISIPTRSRLNSFSNATSPVMSPRSVCPYLEDSDFGITLEDPEGHDHKQLLLNQNIVSRVSQWTKFNINQHFRFIRDCLRGGAWLLHGQCCTAPTFMVTPFVQCLHGPNILLDHVLPLSKIIVNKYSVPLSPNPSIRTSAILELVNVSFGA